MRKLLLVLVGEWILLTIILAFVEGSHADEMILLNSKNNSPQTSELVTSQGTVFVQIEGRVMPPNGAPSDWYVHTRVHLDGGKYHVGFLRPDGSFTVSAVSSGSYLVEVINPTFLFQPVRVDVNSKGKIRVRRFNALQPNAVKVLPYPLQMSSVGKASYFFQREQLRTVDLLMNPTLLFMVVPLLLIMVLPKMYDSDDQQIQRDMQALNALDPRQNLPDMSEMLSSISLLGGGSASSKRGSSSLRGASQGTTANGNRPRTGGNQRYAGSGSSYSDQPLADYSNENNHGEASHGGKSNCYSTNSHAAPGTASQSGQTSGKKNIRKRHNL